MSLRELRQRAAELGVKIDAEKDDEGWGYWLLDALTGEGVWGDDNFCTSHDEIEWKLDLIENERSSA